MKIAIIGASGFVGTRLVEHFHLGDDTEVVAVVRRPSSLALPSRFAMETAVADALDPDAMARAISGSSVVIHAALGDPAQIERMPVTLCLAAASAGVRRLVYLSSASVHGENPPPGTDEATPLHTNQLMDYNRAKARAELKFFSECRRHSLIGFALRPSVVYGPRSRWIADLATELIEGRAWLYQDGHGICNSIYIDNLVHAVACCAHATDDAAGVYLVGDAEEVTWEQFYHAAALHLDVPRSDIHQISRLPAFKFTWQDRANRAAASTVVQHLLPFVPHSLKRSARAVLAAAATTARPDTYALPESPRPRVTQELALLQQCAWKFPHARAAAHLDYRPVVSFAEGMRRSCAWWRFARGEASFAA
ncbi:MAG TPA: NAD(P)-dependent oxidoreductase [Opitutus sp.]|nr:NAD(P)-dependent oxidoreductase [Opitutus sp.]